MIPRKSLYTIVVPLPEEGNTMLIHGVNGNVDLIKTSCWEDALSDRAFDRNSEEVSEEVIFLTKREHLTTISEEDEIEILKERANKLELQHSEMDKYPSFVFVMTYDCNLNCKYCFQKPISKTDQTLTIAQIDQIFGIIEGFERHPSRTTIELFGGEPLLLRNRNKVDLIVKRSSQLGFSVSATTNGYHLNNYFDLLGESLISDLIVTVDGPKEIHDSRRPTKDNNPTFDVINENIKVALDKGVNIYLRVNIDSDNINFLPQITEYYKNNLFFKYTNFKMYYANVKTFPGIDYIKNSITYSEIMDFVDHKENEYPILRGISDKKGDLLAGLLKADPLLMTQTRACGAVGSSLYFCPDFNVFSCQEALGKPEYAIGNFMNGLYLDTNSSKKWKARKVPYLDECQRCAYVLLCAGGCAYRAFAENTNFAPLCEDFPETFVRTIQRERKYMQMK